MLAPGDAIAAVYPLSFPLPAVAWDVGDGAAAAANFAVPAGSLGSTALAAGVAEAAAAMAPPVGETPVAAAAAADAAATVMVIHAALPDLFRAAPTPDKGAEESPLTRAEAVARLALAYAAILREFANAEDLSCGTGTGSSAGNSTGGPRELRLPALCFAPSCLPRDCTAEEAARDEQVASEAARRNGRGRSLNLSRSRNGSSSSSSKALGGTAATAALAPALAPAPAPALALAPLALGPWVHAAAFAADGPGITRDALMAGFALLPRAQRQTLLDRPGLKVCCAPFF
jgi:hypothetical protein